MAASTDASVSATTRVLRRVARRQRLAAVGRLAFLLSLVLAGAYAAAFATSRLLALIPEWSDPATLLAVPAGAVLLALALHRRPDPADTARRIDRHAGSKDLFLTATLLERSAGRFKPIVVRQAEQRAATIAPERVVPYRWERRGALCAAVLGALLLAIHVVPQLDPFGKEEQRQKAEALRRDLVEARKATALRVALLQRKNPKAKTSEQAERALDDLKKTFKAMKPKKTQANLQRIRTAQQQLGELWKLRSQQRLNEAFDRARQSQTLGAAQGAKALDWKRRLQRGDPSGLQKEIDEVHRKIAQLQKTTDSAERGKLQEDVRRRLGGLKDFLANNATSKPMEEATRRALEQLTMGDHKQLSKEALEALKESLDLAKLELDNVGQAIRDLKALEEGLRAAQLARQANKQCGGLDGKDCAGCKSLGDYEDFFKQLMEGTETAKIGPGMGSKGIGKGGEAPEKPEEETDYTPERSRSAFHAGKILLQWKTHGLSDPGAVKRDYEKHVADIKQAASEAVLHEQVPPGYHDAIRKYFDTMEVAGDKP